MTGNTQSGGRFSVNYYQCYGLGHHFFILGSSHGKHFRYSGLVSQYSLLICTQWLFSVFGKLRSGGPSSVFALEARRKGRRFLFPFPRSLTFALSRSPKKITPDRRLGFWSTRLFVLVPRTSLFPQGVTKTMTVAIAWRTGAILARFSGEHEASLERETRMSATAAFHAHVRFALASPRSKKAKKITD